MTSRPLIILGTGLALALGAGNATAAPTIGYTSSQGAWVSYSQDLDECLTARVFVTAYTTTFAGGGTSGDHGELAVSVRDNCQTYINDEGEEVTGVIVFSTGASPSAGAAVAGGLSSATYTDALQGHDENGNPQPLTIDIAWTATGPAVRSTTTDGGVRMSTANRPATAVLNVHAGPYTISGTSTRAEIWRNSYNSIG